MAIIVRDTFTRANSTTTPGNAETGQAWVETLGAWGIDGNKLYLVTKDASNTSRLLLETSTQRYTLSADITYKTSSEIGLLVRYQDATNFYGVAFDVASLTLWKVQADVWTNAGSYSFTPVNNTVYTVKIVNDTGTLTVFLNGTQRIQASTTTFNTQTIIGIQDYGGISGVRFDNVEALDINATVTAVAATSSSAALPPTVSAIRNATVTSVTATSTSQAIAPTVTAEINASITATVLTSTAQAVAPTVNAEINVSITATVATSASTAIAPTVTAQINASVTAIVAVSTLDAIAPSVTTIRNAEIIAVVAQIVLVAIAPIVRVRGTTKTAEVSLSERYGFFAISERNSSIGITDILGSAEVAERHVLSAISERAGETRIE